MRFTNAALAALDARIVAVLSDEHPVTLRSVHYRLQSDKKAVAAGLVDKDDASYERVGRQLLKLRRAGALPAKLR